MLGFYGSTAGEGHGWRRVRPIRGASFRTDVVTREARCRSGG